MKQINIDDILYSLSHVQDGLKKIVLGRLNSDIEQQARSVIETAMMMDDFVKERAANIHKDELTEEEVKLLEI